MFREDSFTVLQVRVGSNAQQLCSNVYKQAPWGSNCDEIDNAGMMALLTAQHMS